MGERGRERPSGKAALSPTSASMRSLPPSPFPANHPHAVFLGFSPSLKASSSSSLFPSFHQKRDGPSCPVLLPTLLAPETHRRRRGRRPPCYSFLVLRRRHGIHTHTRKAEATADSLSFPLLPPCTEGAKLGVGTFVGIYRRGREREQGGIAAVTSRTNTGRRRRSTLAL